VTTLMELPFIVQKMLSEIAEKGNTKPHIVGIHSCELLEDGSGSSLYIDLCPRCAKGGTDMLIIRLEELTSNIELIAKALWDDRFETAPG
jgi:hypothetical protein